MEDASPHPLCNGSFHGPSSSRNACSHSDAAEDLLQAKPGSHAAAEAHEAPSNNVGSDSQLSSQVSTGQEQNGKHANQPSEGALRKKQKVSFAVEHDEPKSNRAQSAADRQQLLPEIACKLSNGAEPKAAKGADANGRKCLPTCASDGLQGHQIGQPATGLTSAKSSAQDQHQPPRF